MNTATVVGGDPDIKSQGQSQIPQSPLDVRVRGITFCIAQPLLLRGGRPLPDLVEVCLPKRPGLHHGLRIVQPGRGRIATIAHVEHQSSQCAQIIGQLLAMRLVEPDQPFAHGQMVISATQFDIGPRHGVVASDNGHVE